MITLLKNINISKSLILAVTFQSALMASVMVMAAPRHSTLTLEIVRMHLDFNVLNARDKKTKQNLVMSREQKVLMGFSIGANPSNDGIPQYGSQNYVNDNLNSAYTTATLLDEAIDKAQTLPVGDRISHFENMAFEIVRLSQDEKQNRPNEELIRITLNRAVDIVRGILPVMGTNNEHIAQLVANLYQEHFNLAKMFANSPQHLNYRGQTASHAYAAGFSIAEFGRIYSTLLWRFSAGLTSKAAKAIMLMKLVGYLGYDVNLDQNHESRSLQEVLADVVRLQTQNANYQRILTDLENDTDASTVNLLKSDVTFILHKLPARLQQAGIRSIGNGFVDGP